MKKVLVSLIRGYRRSLSLDHGFLGLFFPPRTGRVCRYTPSCSDYAILSIEKFGALHGTLMALKRILRCHPWSSHPIDDPVP